MAIKQSEVIVVPLPWQQSLTELYGFVSIIWLVDGFEYGILALLEVAVLLGKFIRHCQQQQFPILFAASAPVFRRSSWINHGNMG
jgi:hypothetical protein